MRIFYASTTATNSFFSSNLWRNNLYLPLVDLGHEVIEFDYDLRKTLQNANRFDPSQKEFIDKNRPKVSLELIKQIKKAHNEKPIDLFFSYFYDACIFPEIIDEIKSLGIKTINWYCNGSYQLNLVSQISPHYDYCLVPEKFRLDDYKKLGANPIYCQEAANPNIYKPHDVKEEFDVTFVGQAYGERPDYIKYLLDNNIDVRVWGLRWDGFVKKQSILEFLRTIKRKIFLTNHVSPARFNKSIIGSVLSDEEMVKTYSRSKINLGFSTCGYTHLEKKRILQVRLRDFEVPMSGGFYIVEYMQELEEFFEIGKEVVCYHDKKDLVDKIKYYLKHDDKREKIRIAGRERCLRDHSWHKRFEMVLSRLTPSTNHGK